MSKTTSTFCQDRLQEKAINSLKTILDDYHEKADEAATVAYDDSFWGDLQDELEAAVGAYKRQMKAGGYPGVYAYLNDLQKFGIPHILGKARSFLDNYNPRLIATKTFWNAVFDDFQSFETNTVHDDM